MEKTKKQMTPLGELVSKSFGIYETLGWKIIGMVILPSLIAAIPLILVVIIYFAIHGMNQEPSIALSTINIVLGFLGILATILVIVVSYLSNIGALILVRENNPKLKIMEALKMSKKYGWKFLWVAFLATLFIMLGFIFFIIPGIMLTAYLAFVSWTVVNENLGGMKAIKRSKELVKKYWWAVFGRQFAVGFVIWLIFFIPAMFIEPETASEDMYNVITQIASWALTPFSLAFSYYMYKDLLKIKGAVKSK